MYVIVCVLQPAVIPDTEPIMFTRLDSERNAKIMKRAVNNRKLDPEHYEASGERCVYFFH